MAIDRTPAHELTFNKAFNYWTSIFTLKNGFLKHWNLWQPGYMLCYCTVIDITMETACYGTYAVTNHSQPANQPIQYANCQHPDKQLYADCLYCHWHYDGNCMLWYRTYAVTNQPTNQPINTFNMLTVNSRMNNCMRTAAPWWYRNEQPTRECWHRWMDINCWWPAFYFISLRVPWHCLCFNSKTDVYQYTVQA